MTLAMGGCATPRDMWWDSQWEPISTAVDSTTVTYYWDPPTTGTPVEWYLLESTNGQEWTTPRAKLRITVPADTPHRVRVLGVDADGNAGPWSEYSREYPGIAGSDTVDIDNPIGRNEHEIKP
jgi:hypothetical protein